MNTTTPRIAIILGALLLMLSTSSLTPAQTKTTSIKGKVFRSDINQPIANAEILFMDDKRSDKHDNTIDTKTDDEGNYAFPNVVAGTYTVSIRVWYPTKEEAPCQLLLGKTTDKNSTVVVVRDSGKYYQQVFIKGLSIKAGKEIAKDFDFVCKSMF